MVKTNANATTGIVADCTSDAFDALPKEVREFLANSLVPWSANWILAKHKDEAIGFRTAAEIVSTMTMYDKREHRNSVFVGVVPKSNDFVVSKRAESRVTKMANRALRRR